MNTRLRERDISTDMSTQKTTKKDGKICKIEDGRPGPKQLTIAEVTPLKVNGDANNTANSGANVNNDVLEELRKLRQENAESFRDLKTSFTRMETKLTDIATRTDELEQRMNEAEIRVSALEDSGAKRERMLSYLLRREANLANKCDDMENRLRRNNIRLYGIPEGSEKDNMVDFVKHFLRNSLKLQDETDIRVERAHRALGPKPNGTAPPRSIIVRFLDFQVKQSVLQQAWSQRNVQFEGSTIYFDQDYSFEVQRKRKRVREVIKRLKEKNIKAQSPYPAQLRIFLNTGTQTFPSLLEAQPTLKELGVEVTLEERETLEMELAQVSWSTQSNYKRRNRYQPKTSEIRAFIYGDDEEDKGINKYHVFKHSGLI